MSWAAVGGAAVGVVGNMMTSDKGGGAGTTTASKEPWSKAAPWLEEQIKAGQGLQSQYTAQPFNAQQLAAYTNMGRQTGYMNNAVPDLLGQISNQSVGFDRSNTNGRVKPYTFNGSGTGAAGGAQSGLLGQLTNPATVGQFTSAANPPAAAPASAPTASTSLYRPFDMYDATARGNLTLGNGLRGTDNGGYGSFNYGEAAPVQGDPRFGDFMAFINAGGDELGLYTNRNGGVPGGVRN